MARLLSLVGLALADQCCFPETYSYRVLSSTFAGDLGTGEVVNQYVARSASAIVWRFTFAGNQLNGSSGWVGFLDGGQGNVTKGYEFSVKDAAGTTGFCCRQGAGGNLEWVVPPRCTDQAGLTRSGSVSIAGQDLKVFSRWADPVLMRRWSLITTQDCVPVLSTGSDIRSFSVAYFDNSGYLAADWDTSEGSKLADIPPICNSAPLCVDPNWKPPTHKPQPTQPTQVRSAPNLGLHPDDILAHPERAPPAPVFYGDLPDAFDWDLDKQKVTPPTDQKALTCGACWAHASAAAVESARAIFGDGVLAPLSIQQLIDCERNTMSAGCGGGSSPEAFDYVKRVGLQTADTYPHAGLNGACDMNPSRPKITVKDFSVAQFQGNETAMRAALYTYGPLVAGVDVTGWGMYSGGVLTTCGSAPSHVILVTGWGTDASTGLPYWRIRNSFGLNWGENGYIRLLRGHNTCTLEAGALWVIYK